MTTPINTFSSVCCMALLTGASAASAQVVNGTFESGYTPSNAIVLNGPDWWGTGTSPYSLVVNESFTDGAFGPHADAGSGNNYAYLRQNSELYQSFQLANIGQYTISFYAFGFGKSVLFDSADIGGTPFDITEGQTNGHAFVSDGTVYPAERFFVNSNPDTDWLRYSYTFQNNTAGQSVHLYFKGMGDYFAIDNVGITSAVPEPETYALLLSGLGMVAWMRRRSTRAQRSQ